MAQGPMKKLSVFLLGGFTMVPKHTVPYETMYRGFGSQHTEISFRGITRPPTELSQPPKIPAIAKEIAPLVDAAPEPVLFHLFSGSVWTYFHFNEMYPELRSKVKGIVFECTPMDHQPEQFGRFLAWKLGQKYNPAYSLPFYPYRAYAGITKEWAVENDRNMGLLPAHLKTMFLYSKKDPIASAAYVENYAAQLRAKGIDTTMSVLPDNARHCLAIRDCPEVYQEHIGSFVRHLTADQATDRTEEFPDLKDVAEDKAKAA